MKHWLIRTWGCLLGCWVTGLSKVWFGFTFFFVCFLFVCFFGFAVFGVWFSRKRLVYFFSSISFFGFGSKIPGIPKKTQVGKSEK